jgi:Holliday junction resolvase
MHHNEAYALLSETLSKYGSSEFGRINQILLGFTLIEAGYNVPTMQLTGRPDIVASYEVKTYTVEVKTSSSSNIVLKNEDLTGVNGYNSEPFIAVLTFPDMPIRWLMVDAIKLKPKVYSKTALELYGNQKLEKDLSELFLVVLEKYRLYVLQGTDILLQIFRRVQDKCI